MTKVKKKENKQNWFFTADEHYGHYNAIKYSDRPFDSLDEMESKLIENHNSIVSKNDTTIHAGDFTLRSKKYAQNIIRQLNGSHIFLKGSHDRWLGKKYQLMIWEGNIKQQYVVICHYAMLTWRKSHYNSWHFYGHSHGRFETKGKTLDIGVDTNNYFPYSFEQIVKIMETKPANPSFIKLLSKRD